MELGGQKMKDLLCKSNPWENSDCGRLDCFSCSSSSKEKEPKFKNCYRRSVFYETWCNTCLTDISRELEPDRDNEETVVDNVSVDSCVEEVRGKAGKESSKESTKEDNKKRKFKA